MSLSINIQVWLYTLFLATSLTLRISHGNSGARGKRLFSLFNVVKFANDPCLASDSKNGTCYTAQECSDRQGSNVGTCAAGYGVCCTFSLGCGEKSVENNTYFQSSPNGLDTCEVEVCPCNSNICRLRLDFSTFVIAGPSSETRTIGRTTSGVQTPSTSPFAGGTSAVTPMTQCIEDQFFVTNPGGTSPPVICGLNTGSHMYVDASPGCNKIGFRIGEATATRQWDIKITQLSCSSDNLPPQGCTQYHFGSATGSIKSFNFDGNLHLAQQNQNICIRRERGMCRICYSTAPNDFDLSSSTAINVGIVGGQLCKMNLGVKETHVGVFCFNNFALAGHKNRNKIEESSEFDFFSYIQISDELDELKSHCCGYGSDGRGTRGYDCVIIPIASKKDTLSKLIPANSDEFCGRGLATVTSGAPATVCSQRHPFQIRFLTDTFEFQPEAAKNPNGFRIVYEMFAC